MDDQCNWAEPVISIKRAIALASELASAGSFDEAKLLLRAIKKSCDEAHRAMSRDEARRKKLEEK